MASVMEIYSCTGPLNRQLYWLKGNHSNACSGRRRLRQNLTKAVAESVNLLFQMTTEYNDIRVVEFPRGSHPKLEGTRALFLEATGNIHSLYRHCKSGSETALLASQEYWGGMAIAVAATEDCEEPVGILGLGSGTTAALIHTFWPQKRMLGWELDGAVLEASRMYMGLDALEQSGAVVSCVGDALSDDIQVEGGFSVLLVDIFSGGQVPQALQEAKKWVSLRNKLSPGGVLVANLGTNYGKHILHMIHAFEGTDVYIKEDPGAILAISGGDPARLRPNLPPELQHAAGGWVPHQEATARWQQRQLDVTK